MNVIRDSFMTVAGEFGFTDQNAPRFTAFATTKERLAWHLKGENRPMFAYCDNGKIVGYYSLQFLENRECALNHLCVIPAYRHKGIGGALLQHAFRIAKESGCSKMNIGIVEENQVLRKWYETFGFLHIGTQKFDFFPFTCGYMVKNLCVQGCVLNYETGIYIWQCGCGKNERRAGTDEADGPSAFPQPHDH